MSANFESGFFVREPAWHGMGTVIKEENWQDGETVFKIGY